MTHFKFSSNGIETLVSAQRAHNMPSKFYLKICETDKFYCVYFLSGIWFTQFSQILSSQFRTKMKIAISVVDQIYLDSFPQKKFCERSRINLCRKEFYVG